MNNEINKLFFNCDCISGAREHLPSGSIDLIISDPPYGIGGDKLDKHYNRDESVVLDGYVEVPAGDYERFSNEWIKEAFRVLRPGGSMYVVSGYSHLREVLNAVHLAGFSLVNHIIWKYNFGVYTSKKYVSSHYHILYCTKPGGEVVFNTNGFYADFEKSSSGGSMNYLDREDVWVINREYKPGEVKNKNELPLALLFKMLCYSSNPGDVVCDFFLGGFSTAKAAIGLGRSACGFELNSSAFSHNAPIVLSMKSGEMLYMLRPVPPNKIENGGKPLSDEEKSKIVLRAKELKSAGMNKKKVVEILMEEYGRGQFSIMNILKSSGV